MATTAIISSSNLDISKVTFSDIRTNQKGGKAVSIKYSGQPLQIRLEKASYPMGVNVKDTDNGTTYTMSLTLKGCDPYAKDRAGPETGSTGVLYNFLQDLQKRILDTAEQNSTKWFGKTRSRSVLEDTMKQFISPSVEKVNGEWVPSGKYPPSLRMKVPVYNGEVAMDVTDSYGKPVEVTPDNIQSVFPKRVDASLVLNPSIYVTGQGFGVTWKITYAKVSPPQRTTAADVFRDEIEEETAGLSNAVPLLTRTDGGGLDEEDVQQEEEVSVPFVEAPAPAPAPAPAAAKSRRRVAVA
jgi:hypothetical protein